MLLGSLISTAALAAAPLPPPGAATALAAAPPPPPAGAATALAAAPPPPADAATALAVPRPGASAAGGTAAATLSLGLRCYPPAYVRQRAAHGLASGFAPGSSLTAALDGRPVAIAGGLVDAAGRSYFSWQVPAPPSARAGGESTHSLSVTDGVPTASRTFVSTRFGADFRPSAGDPRRLRTRFTAFGFAGGTTLYLHYVPPRGRARTRALGRLGGSCGRLATAPMRLFDFTPRVGTWRLQFDSQRRWSERTVPRWAVRYIVSAGLRVR